MHSAEHWVWGPSSLTTIFTKVWQKKHWEVFSPMKQCEKAYFLEERDHMRFLKEAVPSSWICSVLISVPVILVVLKTEQCMCCCKLWNNLYWILILYEVLYNVTTSSIWIKCCYFSSGAVSHFKSFKCWPGLSFL